MSDQAQVSRAALGILGTRGGIYPFKIAIALIVAPLLGTTNYGIYTFLLLPTAVLLPLTAFGIGNGVRYHISNGEYEAKNVAFMAILLGGLNGVVTALLFGGLWHYDMLGETGRAISADLLWPVLAVLPLQGIAFFMNRVMIGASWFTAMNLFIVLNNVAPPAFLLAFVIIGGMGISGAVAAIAASATTLGLVTTVMVIARFRPRIRIELTFLGRCAHYGFRGWIGSLANRASARLDQFVVGFLQAPEVLGVYRIAVVIAETLWMVPDAVNIPLFNRVSQTRSAKERISVVMRSHRVLVPLVAFLALCIFALCWVVLPLVLGPEFIDARWLLALLLPGTVFLVTARVVGMYFNATGEPEKTSAIEVIGMIVALVLYLTLIPLLGVAGAALGTALAYAAISIVAQAMFRWTVRPETVRLYRTSSADIKWAWSLVRESFLIWKTKLRGAS